jgi:hypothetical protein
MSKKTRPWNRRQRKAIPANYSARYAGEREAARVHRLLALLGEPQVDPVGIARALMSPSRISYTTSELRVSAHAVRKA